MVTLAQILFFKLVLCSSGPSKKVNLYILLGTSGTHLHWFTSQLRSKSLLEMTSNSLSSPLSPNSGTVTIENLTNNQRVSQSLNSSASLCRQNAEWIVQDYQRGNSLVSFADFGTVTFTNAVATGTQHYYPSGATIVEIEQNNKVLTNVTTNGSSVTIQYV
ncbi:peptidase A4 family-domain-containing protein [Butyriboletus roseoflavus]|nr:peptidase A4 family-domain-containing protein [Butyriboletus roseoflavus]